MIYLDSSILVELYLSQARRAEAIAVLRRPDPKVSSWLIAVEVPIVLRRLLGQAKRHASLLKKSLAYFDRDVKGMTLFHELPSVAERVRRDIRFAQCRALDAAHVATALFVQQATNHRVTVASFDSDMCALARAVELDVEALK